MISSFAKMNIFLDSTIAIILFAILAFEIWMFVDVIKNKNISETARLWWVVGMAFVHPFVAIYYYFTEYPKNR